MKAEVNPMSHPIFSIISWAGFSSLMASLVHLINPVVGTVGGVLFIVHYLYRIQKERLEIKRLKDGK